MINTTQRRKYFCSVAFTALVLGAPGAAFAQSADQGESPSIVSSNDSSDDANTVGARAKF